MLETMSRGFNSQARNHLPANYPSIDFRFAIQIQNPCLRFATR